MTEFVYDEGYISYVLKFPYGGVKRLMVQTDLWPTLEMFWLPRNIELN